MHLLQSGLEEAAPLKMLPGWWFVWKTLRWTVEGSWWLEGRSSQGWPPGTGLGGCRGDRPGGRA